MQKELERTKTPTQTDRVTRSAIRYFGGKWVIAPWIISHMPPHRVYVEPFGGAGSVLLRKPRSRIEVYNDLDEEIVGIFRIIQEPLKCAQLMRRLRPRDGSLRGPSSARAARWCGRSGPSCGLT